MFILPISSHCHTHDKQAMIRTGRLDIITIINIKAKSGQLEVSDDLGDVGAHPVQLGVLGGGLPVLAARHRVHNVLGEEICRNHWEISGTSCLPG